MLLQRSKYLSVGLFVCLFVTRSIVRQLSDQLGASEVGHRAQTAIFEALTLREPRGKGLIVESEGT